MNLSKKTTSGTDNPAVITREDIDEIKAEIAKVCTSIKDLRKEFKGLVEIQQRLIHQQLGAPVPPPPKEYGEESVSKAKININSINSEQIRVAGNTYDYRSAIKDAGSAKWEQETKSWALPIDSLEKLIENFEALNLTRGTDFAVNVEERKSEDKETTEETPEVKPKPKPKPKPKTKAPKKESENAGFGSGFDN